MERGVCGENTNILHQLHSIVFIHVGGGGGGAHVHFTDPR